MFLCDETQSKIAVTLKKNKNNTRFGTEKLKVIFTISTKSMYLDVLNWPKDFSYFIYSTIMKGRFPDDFIELYICHLESGVNNILCVEQLDSEVFDSFFRDTFYRTNNLRGNIIVKVLKIRDHCKYCITKHK